MAQRGGRRPGAGAPRGNINALSSGRYSTRYSDARLVLSALPDVRQHIKDLYAARDPAARDQHRRYLEAAVWTVDHCPDLADQLERQIITSLEPRAAKVRAGRTLLYMLAEPRDRRHPLQRALSLTVYLQTHDPTLGALLTDHLFACFSASPFLDAKKDPSQSDNQTINAPPEAQSEGPPSPEALVARSP